MQLTSYEKVIPENIIFHEAKEFKLKESNIKYNRIPIEVTYKDGKKGPLVIETPVLFSFGVSEKKNQETGKLNGYSVPVCMWGKDSDPNEKEKAFFDVMNNIEDLCRKYLEKEYGPDMASFMSPILYYKKIEYKDKNGKKRTKPDTSSQKKQKRYYPYSNQARAKI